MTAGPDAAVPPTPDGPLPVTTLDLEPRTVRANGIDVAYLQMGPEDGPLALCMHGFPDHAHTWMYLLPALAEAGFRAVAPWMRGYHPTGLAPGGFYQAGALGADANALHARLGGDERAVLIGHDWGAVAAHSAASSAPERWRRVVTMAVPPGLPDVRNAIADPAQLRRSWYIAFFQLPVLPERFLSEDGLASIHHLWEAAWPPYRDHPRFRAALHRTLSAPGTIDAALGYYRALVRPTRRTSSYRDEQRAAWRTPPQPLLHLHGAGDGAVGAAQAELARPRLSAGSRVEILDGARHWVHLDHPDRVRDLVVGFITE